MRDLRTPTLPSVLTEYSPDFDIVRASKETEAISSGEQRKETSDVKTAKSTLPTKYQYTPARRSPTSGFGKRSSQIKKEDRERQERVADTWDLAKSESIQERQELLSQKVVLQQALIRSQEERSKELRRQEEERKVKKRADDLHSKHARETALEAQCKQAIDQDRKAKRQAAQARTKVIHDAFGSSSWEGGTSPSSPSLSSPMVDHQHQQQQQRTRKVAGHGGYLPCSDYSASMHGVDEGEEDFDDGGRDRRVKGEVVTPADLSEVPWHHAQLYKMYGRNADYYIHPKVQQEEKKVIHPTLKSQKVKKMGHLGASHIWTTLRTDSKSKLFRCDQRFPQELKDAFSAHVREGINNQKKPVSRNFTVTDDVPDLTRLMDLSLFRRVAVLRHKTELMYRSSQTNNDRTKVLLFNNPLPAVSEGDEGIGKYLPSWRDDVSDITEASYMKWLDDEKKAELKKRNASLRNKTNDSIDTDQDVENNKENKKEEEQIGSEGGGAPVTTVPKSCHPRSVLSPVSSTASDSLQTIWHSVMRRQKPLKQPRYHFLTEEEAGVKGAFLEKLGLDKDRLDQGRVDLLPVRNQSFSRQSLPSSLKSLSALEHRHPLPTGVSQNARSESAHNSSSRFLSAWQPLSMHALVEYKEQLATEGHGEFQQGRPRMWPTSSNNMAVEQQ